MWTPSHIHRFSAFDKCHGFLVFKERNPRCNAELQIIIIKVFYPVLSLIKKKVRWAEWEKIQLGITEWETHAGGNVWAKLNTWFRGENCIWLAACNFAFQMAVGPVVFPSKRHGRDWQKAGLLLLDAFGLAVGKLEIELTTSAEWPVNSTSLLFSCRIRQPAEWFWPALPEDELGVWESIQLWTMLVTRFLVPGIGLQISYGPSPSVFPLCVFQCLTHNRRFLSVCWMNEICSCPTHPTPLNTHI